MTGGAERRARRLLAAYPWRVRAERGDEIVATVLDVLAPGADRLPWRDQLDLVRGGMRTRQQRRPPWPTVLAYSLGFRIHPRWIRWVFDDLERPDYVRHQRIRAAVWAVVVMPGFAVVIGDWRLLLYGSGGFIAGMVGVEPERHRRRVRHGLLPGGSDPAQVWVQRWRARILPNLPLARVLVALGAPSAITSVAVLAAVVDDPAGAGGEPVRTADVVAAARNPAVVGVVVGVLVAACGLRRARQVRRADPGPAVSRRAGRAGSAVAAVVAVVLVFEGTVLAANLWDAPAELMFARWGAGVGPVAVALVVVGVRLAALGIRRGAPVGLWDVVPAVGPRRRVYPMQRRWVEHAAGVEPWWPDGGPRAG